MSEHEIPSGHIDRDGGISTDPSEKFLYALDLGDQIDRMLIVDGEEMTVKRFIEIHLSEKCGELASGLLHMVPLVVKDPQYEQFLRELKGEIMKRIEAKAVV